MQVGDVYSNVGQISHIQAGRHACVYMCTPTWLESLQTIYCLLDSNYGIALQGKAGTVK